MLVIEQYLLENYLFRRNVLNGKVEYATKNAEGECSEWRPLTLEAQNSMVLRVLCEGILEKGNPKDLIKLYVESEEVMKDSYPSLMATPSNIIHLGMTMKALEYEFTTHAHTKYYKAVPRNSA